MSFIITLILSGVCSCGCQTTDESKESDGEKVVTDFKRLYRLEIAVWREMDSIVERIQDEVTADQAAESMANLFPLKAEIRFLKRSLRRYGTGPDQQLFDDYTRQRDTMAAAYRKKAEKLVNQAYFDKVNKAYIEMSRSTTTLRPFSVSEGHAQRTDGRQFVIWLPGGATPRIDLSSESGILEVFVVDEETGQIHPQRQKISCGGKAFLPVPYQDHGSLYWLRPVNNERIQDSDLR